MARASRITTGTTLAAPRESSPSAAVRCADAVVAASAIATSTRGTRDANGKCGNTSLQPAQAGRSAAQGRRVPVV